MQKLIDIENQLKKVADSNGLTGDSVDLLIKLLAYDRFEALTSTRVSLLESMPDRSANINSNITHAMDQMYSLYRGTNSRVKVTVTVSGNVLLNRFDKVFSDRNNSLYYSHCIDDQGQIIKGTFNFVYGRTYDLILIKSEEVVSEILSLPENNIYLLESLSSNISETYELKSNLGSELEIQTTKDFGEHIDSSITSNNANNNNLQGGTPIAFDLTTTDYSLRVYAPDSNGFNNSSDYTLKFLPFIAEDIEMDQLVKLNIDGFRVDLDSLDITEFVDRELIDNFLYNLRRESVTQNRTRSNSDVLDSFKTSFSYKIKDVKIKDYILQDDILQLSYIPLDSGINPSPNEINSTEKELYINNLLYYVTKNIEFYPLYDNVNAQKLRLDLDIKISEPIDIVAITDYLKTYEYKIDGYINKHEIIGKVNDFTGVKYCTLDIYNLSSDTPLIPVEELQAGLESYFTISDNITPAYRI
jgi:hypothetical protein